MPFISPAVKPVIAATLRTLLDIGPDLNPRAALGDKGYDSKSNRDAARQRGICPASRIDPTPKICPPSFRKHSTRHGHASNKRSASSNASSVSHSMREDGAELRLVRRACSRPHLDQIRPHGLASSVVPSPTATLADIRSAPCRNGTTCPPR